MDGKEIFDCLEKIRKVRSSVSDNSTMTCLRIKLQCDIFTLKLLKKLNVQEEK